MNRAYRFRLYPDEEQKTLFAKTFGCVRFIYNKMLADRVEHYKVTGKSLHNTPAQYKTEFLWLKEVDSLALANAQLHLDAASAAFFRRPETGFPSSKQKVIHVRPIRAIIRMVLFASRMGRSNCLKWAL